jgi:hypothetical protein
LAALPSCVEFVQLRSELVGQLSVEWVRNHFQGEPLFELNLEHDLAVARVIDD